MEKTLEIGTNYGSCFGFEKEKGQQLIYQGGDTWLAINGETQKEVDSKDTTKKALEYINRPSIHMGMLAKAGKVLPC